LLPRSTLYGMPRRFVTEYNAERARDPIACESLAICKPGNLGGPVVDWLPIQEGGQSCDDVAGVEEAVEAERVDPDVVERIASRGSVDRGAFTHPREIEPQGAGCDRRVDAPAGGSRDELQDYFMFGSRIVLLGFGKAVERLDEEIDRASRISARRDSPAQDESELERSWLDVGRVEKPFLDFS
jgi:hypothetical protein